MTEKEIDNWLLRAEAQKLTTGKSIHRLDVPANKSLDSGFQFAEIDVHDLKPAQ
jgi:hypothetical protein